VDPNPKKVPDSDPDTAIKLIKIIPNNQRLNTRERTKCFFFYSKIFFSVLQVPEYIPCERNESHSLENCHVKILVLKSESENDKKKSGSESEQKLRRIHNTA
jgi:hypothetical protein